MGMTISLPSLNVLHSADVFEENHRRPQIVGEEKERNCCDFGLNLLMALFYLICTDRIR